MTVTAVGSVVTNATGAADGVSAIRIGVNVGASIGSRVGSAATGADGVSAINIGLSVGAGPSPIGVDEGMKILDASDGC